MGLKTKEKEQLMKLPRRMCGLQPALKDPEVLGKVSVDRTSHCQPAKGHLSLYLADGYKEC